MYNISITDLKGSAVMKKRIITEKSMKRFKEYLIENEKSNATVKKYMHDISHFMEYLSSQKLEKPIILNYKEELKNNFSIRSANSMIAALNCFLRFEGWYDLCVKQFKIQNEAYCSEEKELTRTEYASLIRTAEKNKNKRLSLVVQTICGTGIRVSELEFITVEAVCKGEAVVSCKGKTRKIFIVKELQRKLLKYAQSQKISRGIIFVTKNGRPLDRTNIWRQMKSLCEEAGVLPQKVFPHNLRHLFARIFYGIEKDIAKLADVLGHSNINTTRIYIITTGAEHRKRMENMKLII